MCISIRILLGHTFFPYGYNIIADVLHIVINVGIHFFQIHSISIYSHRRKQATTQMSVEATPVKTMTIFV